MSRSVFSLAGQQLMFQRLLMFAGRALARLCLLAGDDQAVHVTVSVPGDGLKPELAFTAVGGPADLDEAIGRPEEAAILAFAARVIFSAWELKFMEAIKEGPLHGQQIEQRISLPISQVKIIGGVLRDRGLIKNDKIVGYGLIDPEMTSQLLDFLHPNPPESTVLEEPKRKK